ncbi:MAG: hypothetical protein EP330_09390 [Deltaproteobacteria bacterium]|nr:MAG: hypothetical protein EP330_09390 [Deltaproteobacteria bacterium]
MPRTSVLLLALVACGSPSDDTGSDTPFTAPVVTTNPADSAPSTVDIEGVIEVEATGPGTITYEYRWVSGDQTWSQARLPGTATTRGETWNLTVTPYAGDTSGPTATASVLITNGEPTLAGASFSPATPTLGQALTCVPDAIDPDGDALSYTYRWELDGTDAGVSGDTLPANLVTTGVLIGCGVTASDGEFTTAEVVITGTVDNGPPSVDGASIVPASPSSTQTATCVPGNGSDPDGDTVSFNYAWYVNAVDVGVNTDTLDPSYFVRGDSLICAVTPTDGVATGAPVNSPQAFVRNSAPEVTSVDIDPLSPLASDTIQCSATATDPDGDNLTYSYRWFINGAEQGETSNLLLPGSLQFQDNVQCEATASDGTETASATSPIAVVGNTPPTVIGLAITPNPANATQALTCAYDSTYDEDGHPVTVSYEWSVAGSVVGSGSTLAAGNAVRDQTVTCSATPNDGTADGSSVTANLVLDNAPPGEPTVSVTPAVPTETDNITCSASATDPDGDSLSYSYTWFVNGSEVAQGAVLTAGSVARGELARCEAVATDGELTGPTGSLELTPGNQIPVINSVTVTPSTALAGESLTCAVDASDGDGDTLTTSYSWTRNGSPLGITSATLDGGAVSFGFGDVLACIATVRDAYSSVNGTSNNVAIGNTPPELAGAFITPPGAHTGQALTCTAGAASDPDGQSVSTSFSWTVDGVAAGNGATLSAFTAARGQTATCTATPTDGVTSGDPVVANIVILNAPPSAPSVTVGPNGANGGDSLVCVAAATDADNDALTYEYTWFVGSDQIGTGASLAPGSASRDEVVRCEARANDGTTVGPAGTGSITLLNQPPTVDSVTVSPASPGTNDAITCLVEGSDDDGDTLTVTYEWILNGTTTSYTGETFGGSVSVGNTLACRATVEDDQFSATRTSSTVTVANSLPVVTGVAIEPTSPQTGDNLTCTYASTNDTDGQSVTVSFRWLNGASVLGTGATLPAGTAKGTTVTCEATPNDGVENGIPVTADTTIVNTPPVLGGANISPTTNATEGTTFTCSAGSLSDADNDSVTVSYAWLRNGSAINGATSTTLTGSSFNKGDSIACRVTPSDDEDTGTAQTSVSVTVQNSAPTGGTVSLSPGSATETSTLTCAGSGATDPDGDSVSYTYRWYNGNTVINGATTATLTGANFNKNDSISCEATPTDGSASGSALRSSSVTIANSGPTGGTVSLTPGTAYEATTLNCSASGATDPDGDTVTYTYAWTKGGTAISGQTGASLTGSSFNKGDVIRCVATPTDTQATGTALTSAAVTIQNTKPTLPANGVSLSPGTAYEGSTLTCSASGGTDADPADTVSYTYTWYVNNSVVSNQTGTTLTGTSFNKNDQVKCRVTPTDGTDTGTPVTSAIVGISNTAPSQPSVTMSPTTIQTLTDITCNPSSTDVDPADTVTYQDYQWMVNSTVIAPTTKTLDEANIKKGDQVRCSAVPSDGTTTGTRGYAVMQTVANTAPSMGAVTVAYITRVGVLSCGGTATDPDVTDGVDTMAYTYKWWYTSAIGNRPLSQGTTATITPGSTGYYYCTKTGSDGTASSSGSSDYYYWDGSLGCDPFCLSRWETELDLPRAEILFGAERLTFPTEGQDDCQVQVDLDRYNVVADRWEAVWSGQTFESELELDHSLQLDDAEYRMRVTAEGCDEELFEVAIDGKWHSLTPKVLDEGQRIER